MASTSGYGASATQHNVFLSFRGPDTRDTFTDCLHHYMVGQGILVYRDSEDLHAGDRIDYLLREVGNSKLLIHCSKHCFRTFKGNLVEHLNELPGASKQFTISSKHGH